MSDNYLTGFVRGFFTSDDVEKKNEFAMSSNYTMSLLSQCNDITKLKQLEVALECAQGALSNAAFMGK